MSVVLSALAVVGAVATTAQQLIALRQQGQEQDALTQSVYADTQARLRALEDKVTALQARAEAVQTRQAAAESKLLNRRQREDLELMLAPADDSDGDGIVEPAADPLPTTQPSFSEMRAKAARGQAWTPEGWRAVEHP